MLFEPGIWVARQRGGLCNNLKCLLSTVRLAERDGSSVVTSSADLAGIYQNVEYVAESAISAAMQTHCDWRFIVFPDDPIPTGFSIRRESRGFKGADPDARNIDHEFERIPQPMRDIYFRVINTLEIKPEIKNVVDAYVEKYWHPDLTTVHMRTWLTDHWDKAPIRHQHYFNIDDYERLVASEQQVFISSDNESFLKQLQHKFGNRVLSYPHNPQFDHSQNAFINLCLLSHGKKIAGSSLSTFTEMAWWLGGCRAEVQLIGANS